MLENKLTGVTNAYSKLDHAQNDKIMSLGNSISALHSDIKDLQHRFLTQARAPIHDIAAEVDTLAGNYDRLGTNVRETTCRIAAVEQSLESGDVDKRFATAELDMQDITQQIKDLAVTANQRGRQQSDLTERVGSLEARKQDDRYPGFNEPTQGAALRGRERHLAAHKQAAQRLEAIRRRYGLSAKVAE